GFCEADAVKHYAPNLVLEPVHIDIAADFDFTATTLHATITHTVRSNRTVTAESSEALRDAATTLELNGVSFDNVKVTGDGVVGFEYDGQIIAVKFAGPATTKGDERKIVITYSVQRPVSGLFWNVAERDLATNGTYIITDHETERARYWLATVDAPTVRTTLTFHLTAPEHMSTVANGIEVSSKPAAVAGRKTTTWHLDYPCPAYLLCMAVGDFTVATDRDAVLEDGRKIPVKYYATKNYSAEDLLVTFKATPTMIEWISKRFKFDMPWFKYSQIASPFVGGAMEDISIVTWGSFAVMNARHARDFGFYIDATNIHEMGHSFFGDATVVRYYEHAWLKESWASYIESLWLEDTAGHESARMYRFEELESYAEETEDYMRPIVNRRYDHSWSMFDGHLYPGGSVRLHMLRGLLGDDVFFAACSAYLHQYAKKTVETDDFRKVLEAHSGLNLTRFFDQWFYSKGYPVFKTEYKYDPKKQVASVSFVQTQADAANGVGLFALDVPVEFKTADGTVHRAVASFDGNNVTATAAAFTGAKAVTVEIDADGFQVFGIDGTFNPGLEILLKTAAEARDPVNRTRAYRTLLKDADLYTVRRVAPIAVAERLGEVRVEIALALSKLRHAPAIDLLLTLAKNETNDVARTGIYVAAAGIKHPAVYAWAKAALAAPTAATDLTYRQLSAVFRAVSASRKPSDEAYFTAVIRDGSVAVGLGDDYKDMVHGYALTALSQYRTESAARTLLAHSSSILGNGGSKAEFPLQAMMLGALGRVAPYVPKPLAETLVEMAAESLDSTLHFRVPANAVLAINNAGHGLAVQYADRILATKPVAAVQDQAFYVKAANKARGAATGPGAAVSALIKRVEGLETQVRDVEAKYLAKADAEKQVAEAAEAAKKETAAASKE
ncbi:hypothetical protein BC828DRAFT_304831, partial [Blastocladiella britannica]